MPVTEFPAARPVGAPEFKRLLALPGDVRYYRSQLARDPEELASWLRCLSVELQDIARCLDHEAGLLERDAG